MLFGVPAAKDAVGSGADRPGRHPQRRARATCVAEVGDATVVMADLCLRRVHRPRALRRARPPTASVDNDATLERYAEMAVAQADAGVARGRRRAG